MAVARAKMNVEGVFRWLDRSIDEVFVGMEKATQETLDDFVGRFKQKHLRKGGRRSLRRRSGDLSRSLGATTKRFKKHIRGTVAFDPKKTKHSKATLRKIVKVHSSPTPTIIKPKGDWLTVPLRAALDRSGRPRKRRARDWPNTFVRKSKRGNRIIFQRRGKTIIPLYVLKKSVRNPGGRLPFKPKFREHLKKRGFPHLKRAQAKILKNIRQKARAA